MKFADWKAMKLSIGEQLARASREGGRECEHRLTLLRQTDREVDRDAQRHFLVSDRCYVSAWVTVDGAVRTLLTRKDDSVLRQTSILVPDGGAGGARLAGFSDAEVSGCQAARIMAARWVSGEDDEMEDGVTLDLARRMWLS